MSNLPPPVVRTYLCIRDRLSTSTPQINTTNMKRDSVQIHLCKCLSTHKIINFRLTLLHRVLRGGAWGLLTNWETNGNQPIEHLHSSDQHLCKFMGTKESVYRKEFNSHRTGLEHQHGRRDVM